MPAFLAAPRTCSICGTQPLASATPLKRSHTLPPSEMKSLYGSITRLRCVTSEDKVAGLDSLVAGKTGFEYCLGGRFAVVELTEPPAARRRIFSGILDHKLDTVLGGPGHERLAIHWPTEDTAKGF